MEVGAAGGNVLDFVAAMERCSVREAALKRHGWFAVAPTRVLNEQTTCPPKEPLTSTLTVAGENKPLGFTLGNVDLHHPYLTERGVQWETASHFGVGFYSGKGFMQGRIVIPVHNEEGRLVAYAGRNLGQSEPSYKFPVRFRKSFVLFNLHRAVHHGGAVIVVEGFFDCLRVHQAGLPCVVALMGCFLSLRQQALLEQHFREVTLMLDGDNAGRRAGVTMATRLATKVAVRIVEVPLGAQPDQLSADQIRCLCDADFF